MFGINMIETIPLDGAAGGYCFDEYGA